MPAPAHTFLPGLRPLITEYPTSPPVPGRFPPPRKRGSLTLPSGRRVDVGSPADGIATVDVPNVRVHTFQIGTGATSRSTVSTPRLVGPAIIRSVSWNLGGAATGTQAIEFGIALATVFESNVGLNANRQWRPLMVPFDPPTTGDIAGRVGDTEADFVSSSPVANYNLNIPILDSNFFITVTNWSSGAGADVFVGHIVVAEGISREALENFV